MYYFAALLMKKNKKTYSFFQLASAVFMIVALLWLTISTPFVYIHQQKIAEKDKLVNINSSVADNDEETANPFGNNTEEKSSGNGNSFSEEYMHDHHINEHFISLESHYPACENAGTYVAFHGELLVPPPNLV